MRDKKYYIALDDFEGIAAAGLGITATATRRIKNSK